MGWEYGYPTFAVSHNSPIKTTVLHPTSATDMMHEDGHLQGLLSEPSLSDVNGRDAVGS
jgi:hypothetical protein